MNISFYLDVTSLVVGGVLGAIITLSVIFAVGVSRVRKAKKNIPNN